MLAQNVLIVANDEELRASLSALCEDIGLSPRCSPDGLHAILSAVQRRPDLIVLDGAMPPVGSLSVAEALRRDRKLSTVPIVILIDDGQPRKLRVRLRCQVQSVRKGQDGRHNAFASELRALPKTARGAVRPSERMAAT
jgi:CheY-like chemotaxis protein